MPGGGVASLFKDNAVCTFMYVHTCGCMYSMYALRIPSVLLYFHELLIPAARTCA